ncbi:hypothetical protein ACWC5I_21855 [Kitasatospora sp. NPDC001574]
MLEAPGEDDVNGVGEGAGVALVLAQQGYGVGEQALAGRRGTTKCRAE